MFDDINIHETFHENTKLFANIHWKEKAYNLNINFKLYAYNNAIKIKPTKINSSANIIEAIYNRRSTREFNRHKIIDFNELSNLLFYSLFNTNSYNKRAYPSAGKRYPIELYLVVFKNDFIDNGIYHINQEDRKLYKIRNGKFSEVVLQNCLNQEFIKNCSFVILFTGFFERTIEKYGERGYRYILIDAGHISENLYLVSSALNIGCVSIGGFLDDKMDELLAITNKETTLYAMAFGKK